MTDQLKLGQPAVEGVKPADDDLILWSVTTINGILDKPALMYWSAEQTAMAAVNQQATWRGMLEDCDEACTHTSARECPAVKWLRDARYRRPKDLLSATDLGSAIHALCEEYALTGVRPDQDRIEQEVREQGGQTVKVDREAPVLVEMLNRFDEWLARAQPSYQATEVTVYSPTYGYAGTADGFLTLDDGFRAIIDYKSSREPRDSKGKPKRPYSEVSTQLAAYRWAESAAVWRPRRTEKFRRRYYALSAEEMALAVPVPEVDGGLCIHITTEACEAYPVRCDEDVHRAFLYHIECARWVLHESADAIGDPLVFPDRQAVAG
jgi:hypothetical protein